MTEPPFTADEACGILRKSIDCCIRGNDSAAKLRAWLTSEFHTPPGTAQTHLARRLYVRALVDLAIYLQRDFDRADLSASLRWSDDRIEAGARGYPA